MSEQADPTAVAYSTYTPIAFRRINSALEALANESADRMYLRASAWATFRFWENLAHPSLAAATPEFARDVENFHELLAKFDA